MRLIFFGEREGRERESCCTYGDQGEGMRQKRQGEDQAGRVSFEQSGGSGGKRKPLCGSSEDVQQKLRLLFDMTLELLSSFSVGNS